MKIKKTLIKLMVFLILSIILMGLNGVTLISSLEDPNQHLLGMGISTSAVADPRAVLLVIIIGVIIVWVMKKKNNSRSYKSRNYRNSRKRQMPAPSRDCAMESCGTISVMPFVCKFCERSFCAVHRLPEKHECVVLASLQKRF